MLVNWYRIIEKINIEYNWYRNRYFELITNLNFTFWYLVPISLFKWILGTFWLSRVAKNNKFSGLFLSFIKYSNNNFVLCLNFLLQTKSIILTRGEITREEQIYFNVNNNIKVLGYNCCCCTFLCHEKSENNLNHNLHRILDLVPKVMPFKKIGNFELWIVILSLKWFQN